MKTDFIYLLETANFDYLLIEVNPPPLPRLNNQHCSQHDHKVRDRGTIFVAKLLKHRNTIMIEIYHATSFIYSYGFPLVLIVIKVCSVRSQLDSLKVLIIVFFGNLASSYYCHCIVVFVLNLLQNNYDKIKYGHHRRQLGRYGWTPGFFCLEFFPLR